MITMMAAEYQYRHIFIRPLSAYFLDAFRAHTFRRAPLDTPTDAFPLHFLDFRRATIKYERDTSTLMPSFRHSRHAAAL